MKIGLNLYPDKTHIPNFYGAVLDSNNLQFARQIGVTHIVARIPLPVGEGYWEFLDLLRLRKFVESYGLKLEAIENLPPLHYDKILLGEEGRDKQIENISKTIVNMSKAGIYCLGYFFSIVGYWGYWRTGQSGGGRGEAGITSFDYDLVRDAPPVPKGEFWAGWKASYFDGTTTVGEVDRDEMWDRLVYFLQRIIPVAEDVGVKLCVHPADPPAPSLRGIGRILNNVDDFKELIRLFPSKYHGIEFCQGTFAEMEGVGKNVVELIQYFGGKRKIFYVHFRNVRGSFPKYDEVFIDEGDVDMVEALKTYYKVGFDGILIPDHVPVITTTRNPWHSAMAYSVGYIKGIMNSLGIDPSE